MAPGPNGAVEVQFLGFVLGDHAAKIAARRAPEMFRLFGRDNGERHRGPIPVHGAARLAPEGVGDTKIAAQIIGGIEDVGPGRTWAAQIRFQLWCEPHELIWSDPLCHPPFWLFPHARLLR